VLAAGINIGTLIDDLNTSNTGESLPLYSRDTTLTVAEDIATKNRLYQANLTAYNDLLKIMDGDALGNFNSEDISVDFLVAMSVTGLVGLRDTDQDGDIDDGDLYLEIVSLGNGDYAVTGVDQFFDYDPDGGEIPAGYDTTGAHYFNALLLWVDDILTNHRQAVLDFLVQLDPELDFDEVNELLDNVVDFIRMYYVNTGGTGNPGIGNNDDDGETDEEHWGDRINYNRDNDEHVWEDATCIY